MTDPRHDFSGLDAPPSDAFTEWFEEEHATPEFELENDVDDVVEDFYSFDDFDLL